MLALMPQSPALPNFYAPSLTTMSLAVLPSSPMTYDPTSIPTLLPPGPPTSKRPKLSLNTASDAPIFGKNATSLRLETLSATSPTTRNTFRNTHEPQRKNPNPQRKPALTPLATSLQSISKPSATVPRSESINEKIANDGRPSLPVLKTTVSTIDTLSLEAPYKLPSNATSILTNGPIPRNSGRRTSFSQTRPMFPAQKKVFFRAQLTEDIRTTKFTMRHSDIESIVETAMSGSRKEEIADVDEEEQEGAPEQLKGQSPRTGEKRDSSDDEGDDCPATPVAGRQKRHRDWRWTLAPVSPASPPRRRQDEEHDIFEDSELV